MSETPVSTPYLVTTPRLTLRCFRPEDAALRKEAVDASGGHLKGFFAPDMTLEMHANHIRRLRAGFDTDGDRAYAAFETRTGRFLGETGLLHRAGVEALEIAYWLRHDATGKGICTEMACAMVKLAFELDEVERLDLMCSPENVRSARVAERLGFTLEGRLRARKLAPHHTRGDLLSYTMLPPEYPASRAKGVPVEAFGFLGERVL